MRQTYAASNIHRVVLPEFELWKVAGFESEIFALFRSRSISKRCKRLIYYDDAKRALRLSFAICDTFPPLNTKMSRFFETWISNSSCEITRYNFFQSAGRIGSNGNIFDKSFLFSVLKFKKKSALCDINQVFDTMKKNDAKKYRFLKTLQMNRILGKIILKLFHHWNICSNSIYEWLYLKVVYLHFSVSRYLRFFIFKNTIDL